MTPTPKEQITDSNTQITNDYQYPNSKHDYKQIRQSEYQLEADQQN